MDKPRSPPPSQYTLTPPSISKPAYQKPPRASERLQVAAYRRLRSNIHEGDFYTVKSVPSAGIVSGSGRVGRKKLVQAAAAPKFDAFESMDTYTHKYTKQRRRLPRLHGRPFILRFFPKELWSTIDPSHGSSGSGKTAQSQQPAAKRRALRILGAQRRNRMELAMDRAEREGAGDDANAPDDDGADGERPAGEDGDVEKDDFDEEPVDDDFGEDEDDMDDENDYNAERYFDGGDEDGGDDDYGGGGMGEDEY